MSPKRLVKLVVGSGQNKIHLWDFDHWTKVRLRRDYVSTAGDGKFLHQIMVTEILIFAPKAHFRPVVEIPYVNFVLSGSDDGYEF